MSVGTTGSPVSFGDCSSCPGCECTLPTVVSQYFVAGSDSQWSPWCDNCTCNDYVPNFADLQSACEAAFAADPGFDGTSQGFYQAVGWASASGPGGACATPVTGLGVNTQAAPGTSGNWIQGRIGLHYIEASTFTNCACSATDSTGYSNRADGCNWNLSWTPSYWAASRVRIYGPCSDFCIGYSWGYATSSDVWYNYVGPAIPNYSGTTIYIQYEAIAEGDYLDIYPPGDGVPMSSQGFFCPSCPWEYGEL